MAKTTFRGYLTQLKQWRFIGYHRKTDRVWADASMYTLIDLHRMEDFVTDLARRTGLEEPAEAVAAIALDRGTSRETDRPPVAVDDRATGPTRARQTDLEEFES